MELIICILVVIALFGIVACILDNAERERNANRKKQDEVREERRLRLKEESRLKYKQLMSDFATRLGECTVDIKYRTQSDGEDSVDNHILVYEDAQTVVLYSKEYKFSDILGCSLVDEATNRTITSTKGDVTTSTGSMLGRAVVGGVLTGGMGALAGAVTAKKNIGTSSSSVTTTTHNYKVYINVNSLQNPLITYGLGEYHGTAHRIAGLINVIAERNKNH